MTCLAPYPPCRYSTPDPDTGERLCAAAWFGVHVTRHNCDACFHRAHATGALVIAHLGARLAYELYHRPPDDRERQIVAQVLERERRELKP
jgi:hypothetical protein